MADDTFGLWREVAGDYVNSMLPEMTTTPFTLLITLHDASVFSVGGYEVGVVLPADLLILMATGPNGWTNFGDETNQLVGFTTPVITGGEQLTVLGQIECLAPFGEVEGNILYQGADPPSIPDHDGPVIAIGIDPDDLIACGFVTGSPVVFRIGEPCAVEDQTWSGVKALFD